MSEKVVYIENDKYKVVLEEGLGNEDVFIFLHLEIHVWNKTVLLELREHLYNLLKLLKEDGHLLTGFYLEWGGETKFHEMLRPLDFKVEEGGHTYGGWYLEDI